MAANDEAAGEKIEWDSRRLHKYSLEQIQDAFGKALQELTGNAYAVEIRTMNRHPEHEHAATLYDIVDMTLRVKEDTGPSPF